MQEGLFLYEQGLDPYDGGIFHQVSCGEDGMIGHSPKEMKAPLLLPLFSLLPSPSSWVGQVVSVSIFTALDILSAHSLFEIASSAAAPTSSAYASPRKDRSWKPISIAAM